MNYQVVATLGIDEVGTSVEGSLQEVGHKVLVKLLGFHCVGVLTKIVQLRLEEVEIGSLNWLLEPSLVERLFWCHMGNCQGDGLVECADCCASSFCNGGRGYRMQLPGNQRLTLP